jgi:hypothetical protein
VYLCHSTGYDEPSDTLQMENGFTQSKCVEIGQKAGSHQHMDEGVEGA